MNKKTLLVLAAICSLPNVYAQKCYEMGNPNDTVNYGYLKYYKPLKEYIDRDAYPEFKLGCAIAATDYLNNAVVRNVTNGYFDEVVTGNAMKMASCVSSDGSMNFTTVKNFVSKATSNGLKIYGHTLAWHSQQAVGWLRSLIKDKPAEELTSGDVKVSTVVSSKDFRTDQSVGWGSDQSTYGYTLSYTSTDGLNIHTTKTCSSWEVQFQAFNNLGLTVGNSYTMKILVKGSKAGKLHTKVGDWNGGRTADIAFTTEWQEIEQTYSNITSSDFLLLQCGDFVGDIYIKTISFNESKWALQKEEDRRCLKFHATARNSQTYDNQFWLYTGSFAAGTSYVFTADVRADKAATASTQIHNAPSNYVHYEAIGSINFTTDWKTITVSGTLSKAGQSIAFNISELADSNNYYLDNISFKINGTEKIKNGDLEGDDVTSFYGKEYGGTVSHPTIATHISYLWMPSSTPLTDQERHDTLVYAMDKWISGMMTACNGKVLAWDLANETVSGGGNDGSGFYTLQHGDGYVSTGGTSWDVGGDSFYWQDFMGDLEYVRQACRLARKYGPEDVKLFINDYNLESDWDSNAKVKSLINWIKKWEADGVTKIDGIGTQMHISCYMNASTQNSKKTAITNMFKLMAATGKYVRVSEFDMGMVDANGNNVSTANMTEEMHHKMADFYEWIVKQYLTIVPPAQQWGFCQWCATDSPTNSGWRADTPVGLWALGYNVDGSLNYAYRKHTYAGVAKGLGAVVSAIDQVDADEAAPSSSSIFDLRGRRLKASFDELPNGIYLINGKKVLKQ